MRRACIGLAMAALTLLGTACGTIGDMGTASGPNVYGGVRYDAKVMGQKSGDLFAMIGYIFDMPISFVFDTVLLPVTIPLAVVSDDEEEDAPEE